MHVALPPAIQALRDVFSDHEFRIRELTAENAALRTELDALRTAAKTPEDQWGVKVWTDPRGDLIRWQFSNSLSLDGAVSMSDITMPNMDTNHLASRIGRLAGQDVAGAVAEKVTRSIANFIMPAP